jgi:phosphonopyruvate decarboxylase
MISASSFCEAAKRRGFDLWTGVPCSYLKPFINYVIDAPDLEYVGAANEGDAIAIGAGAEIGGRKSVVMFQNSGFGNTVNPLTSINMICKIPSLIITTWRGEPGGAHDEPQHELMGEITPALFDTMKIRWEFFPVDEKEIETVLSRATDHMERTREPYGLIMKKDSVAPQALKSKAVRKELPIADLPKASWPATLPSRREILSVIQKASAPTDALIATTGFAGRVLYALEDRPNQLYMVGGMGCASSLAQGLALAQQKRRVICLDGDGAALMRLGALATLGYERPKNLLHFILDNEVHDSTGGQFTVSHSVDLARVAAACGYPKVLRTSSLQEIEAIVRAPTDELTLVHVKMKPGESADLPRPKVTPEEVVLRMKGWLAQ